MPLHLISQITAVCPEAKLNTRGIILIAGPDTLAHLMKLAAPQQLILGINFFPTGINAHISLSSPNHILNQEILSEFSGSTWIISKSNGQWTVTANSENTDGTIAHISKVTTRTLDDILISRALPAEYFGSLHIDNVSGNPLDILKGASTLLPHLSAITLRDCQNQETELTTFLFDQGFVRLTAKNFTVFVRSDVVKNLSLLDSGGPGTVSTTTLGELGRFGNQVFQYLHLAMYGIRRNAKATHSPWIGAEFFDLKRSSIEETPKKRPTLECYSNDISLLEFWSDPCSPTDVDIRGYYQLLPPVWRNHKSLVSGLLTVRKNLAEQLDAWLNALFEEVGTRVVIHVRRGDYTDAGETTDIFRPIPIEWYLTFLESIWPTLDRPKLLIATDGPADVLPKFSSFSPANGTVPYPDLGPESELFADYYAMMRADVLCIANSSLSRSAALLNPDARIYSPSHKDERIRRFFPWQDSFFWDEFSLEPRNTITDRRKMAEEYGKNR